MDKTQQPSKELVRDWLKDQIGQNCPPPCPSQIRAALGWTLDDSLDDDGRTTQQVA